jgi:hypothetical protein
MDAVQIPMASKLDYVIAAEDWCRGDMDSIQAGCIETIKLSEQEILCAREKAFNKSWGTLYCWGTPYGQYRSVLGGRIEAGSRGALNKWVVE